MVRGSNLGKDIGSAVDVIRVFPQSLRAYPRYHPPHFLALLKICEKRLLPQVSLKSYSNNG